MLAIEAPADAGFRHPPLEPFDRVVVKGESSPYRLTVAEVEDLRRGHPLAGQLEQVGDHAEHRIGLTQGTVGQAYAQVGRT